METKRRKKTPKRTESQDNSIPVRVSPRAPRQTETLPKRASTPPVARAQNLATAMLEAVIGQMADYIENSHAVEKLIRAQTARVLQELADDPKLARLIHAQVEQYIAEMVTKPEILEPLVRSQLNRYLDSLSSDPNRLKQLGEALASDNTPAKRPRRNAKTEIKLD